MAEFYTLHDCEREELIKLINHLHDTNFFKSVFDENDSPMNYNEDDYYYVESGQTKICVIPFHMDWVLKFDWPHTRGKFAPLTYTERETEVYELAAQRNLSQFFAPTIMLGEFFGFKIAAQAKAEPNEDSIDNDFYEYVSSGYDKNDFNTEDEYYDAVNSSADDLDDRERLEAVFGYVPELFAFIDDNDCNDLHQANFGFINEMPVLIDFGGY